MTIKKNDLIFMSGFGNHFSTECLPGALPKNQNSPQKHPLGLYAEQLSGSAFTAPRAHNLKTWLYRIRPSVLHSEYKLVTKGFPFFQTPIFSTQLPTPPTQMRWNPMSYPEKKADFLDSIKTMVGNGGPSGHFGCAIHHYAAEKPMLQKAFLNADGDFLIVPEDGSVILTTELGLLHINPGDCAVIPRGMKWKADPKEKKARGYICENFGLPFQLPELGPIGANGLANPRHFLTPTAFYEEKSEPYELITKFQGNFWSCDLSHSPFDILGWMGNFVPYQYDLRLFNTINTVSFDHPDPSIFTVLSSPSNTPGVANIDFVIFPERWMVAENTFRPPYYHRNIMSEYMGLIYGEYDAKPTGFSPGGASLHNAFSAHGPDASTFEKAAEMPLKPEYYKGTLAFMFETSLSYHTTDFALKGPHRQKDYLKCWDKIQAPFFETKKK